MNPPPPLHPWVIRIGARLTETLDPIALYAFGSSVRLAPDLGRDIDFLVTLARPPLRSHYQEVLTQSVGGLSIKVDLVCRTPSQLAADLTRPRSFVASIWSGCRPLFSREGVELLR